MFRTATVADGGPQDRAPDPDYVPPPGTMGEAHEGNPVPGVSFVIHTNVASTDKM